MKDDIDRRRFIRNSIIISGGLALGCNNHQPPDIQPPQTLPEIAFKIPLQHNGLGWINPAMLLRGDRLGMVVSHWSDNDKWIEVWEIPEPGETAAPTVSLIWSCDWWSPRPFLHYEDCDFCQGPLVAANFTGGKAAEICFLHYHGHKYWLRLVGFEGGNSGQTIGEINIPGSAYAFGPPSHILACNMSKPRGNRYSDIIVCWQDRDVTRELRCYSMPDMQLRWTYRLEHEGYFNRNWGMHRPFIIPWPNGKDVVCFGIGIADWNGKGELGQSFPNHPPSIEFLKPDGSDLGNTQHIDSVTWFDQGADPPYILLTQDGREVWAFPELTMQTKANGFKYWQYRYSKKFEDESVATHTHRLRALAWPWFLATDVYRSDGYHAQIWNAETLNKRFETPTKQEAERIAWLGNGEYQVLTEYGIYDKKGVKIANRRGTDILENNFIADFYRFGHEQYIYAQKRTMNKWSLVAVANPNIERQLVPIPVDPNGCFY